MNNIRDYLVFEGFDREDLIFPVFILKNTNKILFKDDIFVEYLFFVSRKKIKNLVFYYYYFCIVNSETQERIDSNFQLFTSKQLKEILCCVKKFLDTLKDKELDIFTFKDCATTHESAQKLLEQMTVRNKS